VQYGGRLVKIDDAETSQFIVTALNGLWWRNRGVWIGLHDRHSELRWQWAGSTRCEDNYCWRRGVVVSGIRRMNEVNARRARLVPGWVTVFGRVYHLGM